MSAFNRRLVAAGFVLGLVVIGWRAHLWQPAIDDVLRPAPSAEETMTAEVRLYFADGDAQCLLVEKRAVAWDPEDGAGRSAGFFPAVARAALEQLVAGPRDERLWPVIPPGARVLSVALHDGVAVVNFSEHLRSNHGGGSAGEMLTVGAVAGTLSEFPGVEAVRILLEGAAVETLVGHFSLLDPIRIDPDALASGRICWDGIQ